MTSTTPDWIGLLRAHTARFADVLDGADLGARVTYCPDWSLHDLAVHLGGVHQWAAHAVVEGDPDHQPVLPSGRSTLVEWYARSAARLLDVLSASPAGAPAWTLDRDDRTAGFWRRRQVHETAMHLWDAEDALGAAHPMEPWLAWDGVLEVVDVMYPRQVRLGRTDPLTMALRLVATDVDGEVTLGADSGAGEVVVEDRAEVVLRLLWHRADPASVGPRAAALLASSLTP